MLGEIIKKEFLESILSFRLLFAFLLSAILFPASFYLMIEAHRQMQEQYSAIAKFMNSDTYAARVLVQIGAPPIPTAAFAYGSVSSLSRPVNIGRRLEIQVSAKILPIPKREQYELVLAYFPAPDFLFLAKVIFSLLGLMFAATAICGEREKGTLRLLMAAGVPRRSLFFGKWFSCTLAISLVLLFFLIVGLVQFSLSPHITFGTQDWLRTGLIAATTLLYIMIFVNIGLAVSSFSRNSYGSTIAGLLFWLMAVLVIPGLATQLAPLLRPVPLAQQVQLERMAIEKEVRDEFLRGQRLSTVPPEKLFQVNQKVLERVDALDVDYMNRIFAQIRLAERLAAISPVAAFNRSIMGLAGTGIEDEHNYFMQLKRYVAFISRRDRPMAELAALKEPERLPQFTYIPYRLGETFRYIRYDLVVLAIYFALSLFVALRLFDRYDVR